MKNRKQYLLCTAVLAMFAAGSALAEDAKPATAATPAVAATPAQPATAATPATPAKPMHKARHHNDKSKDEKKDDKAK